MRKPAAALGSDHASQWQRVKLAAALPLSALLLPAAARHHILIAVAVAVVLLLR